MQSCKFLWKGIGSDGWASLCHSCNVFLKKGGFLGAHALSRPSIPHYSMYLEKIAGLHHVNSLETMVLHLGLPLFLGAEWYLNCILLDMLGARVMLKEKKMLTILTFFTSCVHAYIRGSIPDPCLTVPKGVGRGLNKYFEIRIGFGSDLARFQWKSIVKINLFSFLLIAWFVIFLITLATQTHILAVSDRSNSPVN